MNDSLTAWQPSPEIRAIAERYLSHDEVENVRRSGWGRRGGVGSRWGLVVVDVTDAFCGPTGQSSSARDSDFFNACGPAVGPAVRQIERLLALFREHRLPVWFTKLIDAGPNSQTRGRWTAKNPNIAHEHPDLNRIVEPLAPIPGEPVLQKDKPSAFFGTDLTPLLIDAGVDTLVVCGTTTSGCVRATVVDAFSYNYRVVVPADATFDRWQVSHDIALFDLDAKYADVMSTEAVCEALLDHVAGLGVDG